jgi:hypothetical protein
VDLFSFYKLCKESNILLQFGEKRVKNLEHYFPKDVKQVEKRYFPNIFIFIKGNKGFDMIMFEKVKGKNPRTIDLANKLSIFRTWYLNKNIKGRCS